MKEASIQKLRNIQYFLEGYSSGREQKTLITKDDIYLISEALLVIRSQEDQISTLEDEISVLTKELSKK